MAHAATKTAEPTAQKSLSAAPAMAAAEAGPLLQPDRVPSIAASGDPLGAGSRYAAVLRDPRLRATNDAQRFRLVQQLQRGYGNGHVARVMARLNEAGNTALQRKECPPEPVESSAPTAPSEDPHFQAVEAKTEQTASKEKKHASAKAKVGEAQAAAVPPANEVSSKAGANQVGAMNQQQPGMFDKAAFVAKVNEAITAITPKSEDEAAEFKRNGRAGQVGDRVKGMVGEKRELAEKAIKEKSQAQPDSGKITPKPVTPMQAEEAGPPASAVGADKAMPRPKPAEEVSLDHTACETDGQMAEAGVSEEQLKKSNEPEFNKALDAKQTADTHAAQAPQEFRQQEQSTLNQTRGEAQVAGNQGVAGMHAGRVGALGTVTGEKGDTKTKDEAKRAEFAKALEDIYTKTKTDVSAVLDGLTTRVDSMFTSGEQSARSVFENYVDTEMVAYKKKRYSGLGAALAVTDTLKITSLPPEVNEIYQKGREGYLKTMQILIGHVADLVAGELNHAKMRIAQGRQEIDTFVAKQPKALQALAKEAAGGVQGKFDQLDEDVNSKQDELVQGLAQKYSEALKSVDDKITKMKEANKGLLDRAKEAIGGVIDTIINLKNMLMGILAKAAGVINTIIKDPIGFLGNLVSAIKMGLNRFVGNIGKHLKNGLTGWLFGTLAEGGITLPKSFDLKGILDLVLQLLGVTYANIRARAVKIVGEKTIAQIEQTVEIFKILITVGPSGLWEMIKDSLSSLKEQAMGAIQDFVITKVITAGITWMVSLLNPASAFVKACKMIYDVVMFFVERASQIGSLVNSILDSVGAIAGGALDSAAALVEQSLAKAVPVAISFLASLLGVGGIAEKIKEIIGKIQKPIGNLIDKLVMGAVKGYKKIAGKAKAGFAWAKGKAKQGFAFLKTKAKQGAAWAKNKIKQGVAYIKTKAKQGAAWAKKKFKKTAAWIKGKYEKGKAWFKKKHGSKKDSHERLEKGIKAGVKAFNKLEGRRVGAVVLKPLLFGIRSWYRLDKLYPVPVNGYWAVDGEVKRKPVPSKLPVPGKIAKMPECEIEFVCRETKKGHDSIEFTRQVKMQQRAINSMFIPKWLRARYMFTVTGRHPKAAGEQKKYTQAERANWLLKEYQRLIDEGYTSKGAKSLSSKNFKKQAALHRIDQVAGGHHEKFGGLGDSAINSSIGPQWNSKDRIHKLVAAARAIPVADRKNTKMNAKLTVRVE